MLIAGHVHTIADERVSSYLQPLYTLELGITQLLWYLSISVETDINASRDHCETRHGDRMVLINQASFPHQPCNQFQNADRRPHTK